MFYGRKKEVKTEDILGILDTIAPFDLAEEWDNCGLQVGNLNWKVEKILIGLDVSIPIMDAAADCGADLVLTHHPLMISPENVVDFGHMPGRAVEICAKNKISIVSAHTNLDKAREGLNDYFAAKIGLKETRALAGHPLETDADEPAPGIGRVGRTDRTVSLGQFAAEIKERLSLDYLRVTGDMDMLVNSIAVCTGSGGSLISDFFNSNTDVYITGDMKYHEARLIEEAGRGMIDVGHFGSEHMAVDLLFEKMSKALSKKGHHIEILKFKKEKDPFTIV